MKTRIYGTELEELAIEVDYPESFVTPDHPYCEKEYSASAFLGEGFYKEVFFEGMHIGYGDFRLAQPTLAYFDTDMEMVEMHFALGGLSRATSKDFTKEINFNANQHNLIYSCEFRGSIEWSAVENM